MLNRLHTVSEKNINTKMGKNVIGGARLNRNSKNITRLEVV